MRRGLDAAIKNGGSLFSSHLSGKIRNDLFDQRQEKTHDRFGADLFPFSNIFRRFFSFDNALYKETGESPVDCNACFARGLDNLRHSTFAVGQKHNIINTLS